MKYLLNQYERNKEYIVGEGLDRIINFIGGINNSGEKGVYDSVSGEVAVEFAPIPDDLVRLHKLIRTKKPFTILEFGVGYSTVVMADALLKNQQEWDALGDKPSIRNRHMFKQISVDTSEEWINKTKNKLPDNMKNIVSFNCSDVEIGTFQGQLCHYYNQLPDIIPDFIYLDGPFTKDIKGEINGMSFCNCDERTVMAADLLLMEPTFLPGTTILVDGRVNNARFLERNFSRDYLVDYDKEADVTTFVLNEDRLGKYNILGSDCY